MIVMRKKELIRLRRTLAAGVSAAVLLAGAESVAVCADDDDITIDDGEGYTGGGSIDAGDSGGSIDAGDSGSDSAFLIEKTTREGRTYTNIRALADEERVTELARLLGGEKITDSVLDTKDAFWHSKNVTVKNCVVKGEYLAWFSQGLTLINCRISGTQPLCYCRDLTLIDCEMTGCDLSFEYSDVQASINGHIDSVKNPRSGSITADSIGEVIWEDAVMPCDAQVIVRK